ncbi:MAG TPA: hypothetical protein PKJ47_05000 [Candidatus Limiplasma sp.]|nr:hypothetical protein [Candidatus Limiplasma sp.]
MRSTARQECRFVIDRSPGAASALIKFEQALDTRAIVTLRDDTGSVNCKRIGKHDPKQDGRANEPENPEGKNSQKVRQLAAAGLNHKPLQIFRGEVRQVLLAISAADHCRAIRQPAFPALHVQEGE